MAARMSSPSDSQDSLMTASALTLPRSTLPCPTELKE
jgi:hypothetical protein